MCNQIFSLRERLKNVFLSKFVNFVLSRALMEKGKREAEKQLYKPALSCSIVNGIKEALNKQEHKDESQRTLTTALGVRINAVKYPY